MFRSPRMMHILLSSFIFCSFVSTWLVKWFRHSMVPPGCLYNNTITNFLLGCVFRHVSNQMFSISSSCPLICLLSIIKSSLASILKLLLYILLYWVFVLKIVSISKQLQWWISLCIRSSYLPYLDFITWKWVRLDSSDRIWLKPNILWKREGIKSRHDAGITPSFFLPWCRWLNSGMLVALGMPPSLLWMSCFTPNVFHILVRLWVVVTNWNVHEP